MIEGMQGCGDIWGPADGVWHGCPHPNLTVSCNGSREKGHRLAGTQKPSMVAARISLVLRKCRPRPLDAWGVLIDGNRSSGRSWRGQFVGGMRLLCCSTSPSGDAAGAGVEADDMPSLREYIATLGVFFTLQEQGVTTPEILTRFGICLVWQVIRPRLWPYTLPDREVHC